MGQASSSRIAQQVQQLHLDPAAAAAAEADAGPASTSEGTANKRMI
jgi:hypothetical protein